MSIRLMKYCLIGLTTSFAADLICQTLAYEGIPDYTWVLLDEGTYEDRDAGLDPPFGILAFSGMAIDSRHQKLLLFGGGHNDYWGNEVWTWDINQQRWQKMYEPDPLANIELGACKVSVDNVNFPGMWLPSLRPISRHTYDSVEFIEHAGVMVAGGASTYSGPNEYLWSDTGSNPNGCYLNSPSDFWIYDFAANQWTYKGSALLNTSQPNVAISTYDSDTGHLIAYTKNSMWFYDIDNDLWIEKIPDTMPTTGSHQVMTYDSKRKLAYLFGGDYPSSNDLWIYSVNENSWSNAAVQGNWPSPGGGYGVVYDSVNDVVIVFGKDGLWVYHPDLNQWEQNPGNPSVKPENKLTFFGVFKYDPVSNVSFLVHGTSDWRVDVWAYRYKQAPTTDVKQGGLKNPDNFQLFQNYPNPFNPETQIGFHLPQAAKVKLIVYDTLGTEVNTLVNRFYEAGRHVVKWNGKSDTGSALSSGLYFYKLLIEDELTLTKRMLLLK